MAPAIVSAPSLTRSKKRVFSPNDCYSLNLRMYYFRKSIRTLLLDAKAYICTIEPLHNGDLVDKGK